MSKDIESLAWTQIDHFERSVEKTIENVGELEPTGRYKARTPLVNRFCSKNILDHIAATGIKTAEIKARFEAVNDEFERFRTKKGEIYNEMLHTELEYLLGRYARLICHFMELEPIHLEFVNHLDIRDGLEVLLIELDEIADIEVAKIKTEALDEVFACKDDENLREILDFVEAEDQSAIEVPYLPSRFWWRHPSEHVKWWEMIEDTTSNDTR